MRVRGYSGLRVLHLPVLRPGVTEEEAEVKKGEVEVQEKGEQGVGVEVAGDQDGLLRSCWIRSASYRARLDGQSSLDPEVGLGRGRSRGW